MPFSAGSDISDQFIPKRTINLAFVLAWIWIIESLQNWNNAIFEKILTQTTICTRLITFRT